MKNQPSHPFAQTLLLLVVVTLAAVILTACTIPAAAGGGPATSSSLVPLRANAESLPRSISVNGTGAATAAPDVANVNLGVETISPDPAEAVSQNNEKMTAVMTAIASLGIAPAGVQTINYTMSIEQVTDKEGIPTGETRYHVNNQIRVEVTDLTQTGNVLQKALAAGANTVAGVDFSVADVTALQQQARDKAMANAKAKAEQLAAGFGVKLGAVHNVNEFSVVLAPMPMAEGIGGGGPVPVHGGSLSVSIEIQVVYDLID